MYDPWQRLSLIPTSIFSTLSHVFLIILLYWLTNNFYERCMIDGRDAEWDFFFWLLTFLRQIKNVHENFDVWLHVCYNQRQANYKITCPREVENGVVALNFRWRNEGYGLLNYFEKTLFMKNSREMILVDKLLKGCLSDTIVHVH